MSSLRKKPNYFTFGMIWFMAAIASFTHYVNNVDPADLTRAGFFMLIGVIYIHMSRQNRRK